MKLKNLAHDPAYGEALKVTREKLIEWEKQMPDLSFYPEFFLIKNAFDNPAQFGQQHEAEIHNYIDIANLSLLDFEKAKSGIEESLKSDDPWSRYWGLITCSSFGENAMELLPEIKLIAANDPEYINKVRAAEFLGIAQVINPAETMTNALYSSEDGAEATLILNSIVLMRDGEFKYPFDIKYTKISQSVREHESVKRRLDYLNVTE